ncbi:MAG: metallophosphoesterase [Planctomycetaceae bacterium]|nr:metallophosphoesterase [Planctomycetaceae bacterium]
MDGISKPINRRTFVRNGSLYLLGAGLTLSHWSEAFAEESKRKVRVGLVTDMHYADKKPAGSRHYRETLAKLEEAAQQFQKDEPDHIVELGDFIDAADSVAEEKRYLKRINKDFQSLPGKKHCVLGNHCVFTLTKEEFLEGVEQKSSYYSFEANGFHFVILDACFRSDGQPYGRKNFQWTDPNIPEDQVEWLKTDLKKSQGKAVVFVHQRLDVSNHYGVKNAPDVRKVLEDSGKVLAVFQGHSHKNDLKEINGIPYCVHRAMVEGSGKENNGYSTMDIFESGTIRVAGFRHQKNYEWQG